MPSSDFTDHLPSNLRAFARTAIAARRARNPSSDPQAGLTAEQSALASVEAAHRLADFDPPSDFLDAAREQQEVARQLREADFDPPSAADFETLDTVEVLHRLCEQIGARRVGALLTFVAAARGEEL